MNKRHVICGLVLGILLATGCAEDLEQKKENKAPAVSVDENQEQGILVEFSNPIIQKAVQKQLNKEKIYESDIEKVKRLTIEEEGQKIDGSEIRQFENLIALSVSGVEIENLSELWELEKLETLCLRNDNISDLQGIEKCQTIQYLDLRGNPIDYSEELEKLQNLHTIYVSDSFDRSCLEFLVGHFRNADVKTKQYLLSKQYHLE